MDSVKEGIRRNLVEMLALSGKRNIDLAKACGVGKSAVSNWLSGKSSIDIERIPSICDFLDVTMDEFFGRSKAMEPQPSLSPDEQHLIALYRNMDREHRDVLMQTARAFSALTEKDGADERGAVRVGAVDAVS